MKEMLLFTSIHEHIQLIKMEPSNAEAHASLATTYRQLSRLYIDPRKIRPELEEQWIPPAYFSEEMYAKFKSGAERAIEEFKILQDYLPNDPWIHAQLASLYHDLEMPAQEIQEYETLLKLAPQDKEVLFRLGILYFEQGHNARALRIYELLKKTKDSKAEELIAFYDAYLPQGYLFES
jgi:tetratricopeptide (TPR) repeat protein